MKKIRIGTRSSKLALFQANQVVDQLNALGYPSEIVTIESTGDTIKEQPLYEIGITGIFTKRLDTAVLNGEIDLAVHSFKDVPTALPQGLAQAAVLKRDDPYDLLVSKKDLHFFEQQTATIASGSIRRRAQWLHRYPNHQFENLRGNIGTRLEKLENSDWDGAIFASVALKRLDLFSKKTGYLRLDWMIPAPGQGAIVVLALQKNTALLDVLKNINDVTTELCVKVERDFLRTLEGGCSAPIGALAEIKDDELSFKGVVFNTEGSRKMEFSKTVPVKYAEELGFKAAQYLIERGAKQMMRPRISSEKQALLFSTKILTKNQLESIKGDVKVEMSNLINIKNNRLKPHLLNEKIENAVFTSQNAVEALLSNFSVHQLKFNNIYCVGIRTKTLIESRIGEVKHACNSAEKLADYLVENLEEKSVSFFCGDKRRDDLPKILIDHNIDLKEIECYKTVLTKKIVDENIDGILFYSPSGIESYMQKNKPNKATAFCIGDTTANVAKKYFKSVKIAKESSVKGMIALVNNHYK
jgi:hydroxymethylbilane synthase